MSLTTPAASSASIAAAIVCRERPTRGERLPAHSVAASLTTALASLAYQLVPTLRAWVDSRVYLAAGDDRPPGDRSSSDGPVA